MSARWYKRCGADFIHGTMSLTLEEKGAYSLCLDLIYDRGGPIPDDARWLSGVCGVSIRKWTALRETLVNDKKLYVKYGMISNARADFEIVSAELSSRKLRESGAKGGRKRAENASQPPENNDLGQATLKPKDKIREDKIDDTKVSYVVSVETPPAPANDFEAEESLKPAEVVEAWNIVAAKHGLPLVKKLTPARQRALNARLRQHTIEDFTEAIAAIGRSPFLHGENNRGWRADFDFLLQPTSFLRLIEGTYDSADPKQTRHQRH